MNPLYLAPTSLLEAEPLAFVRAAGAVGYDGVGLRLVRSPSLPFHPVLGNAPLIRDIKRELRECHLGVLDIFTYYLLPETDVAAFAPALALGAELGASYVVVQGNDPDWGRLTERFGRFCDAAASFGLIATVEFMPARVVADLKLTLRLLDEAGRGNVSICVDPLHLARSGGTAADVARVDRDLLAYAQLSDGELAPGEPDLRLLGRAEMGSGTRRMPGEGNLPLADIMRALPAGLPLSVEVMKPADWRDTDTEWARRTLAGSRAWIASVFPEA